MKSLKVFALLTVLVSATAAKSQIGVYAGFTGAHLDSPFGTNTVYGPLVGVYLMQGHVITFGADIRGSFLNGHNNEFYTGALGPRVAVKPPVLPFKVYGEALGGVGYYSASGASVSAQTTYFNYQLLAGLDATILPRIDWRVIEFDYSALSGSSVNSKSLTTGLVFRLPTF
jgi:hypothetical protein